MSYLPWIYQTCLGLEVQRGKKKEDRRRQKKQKEERRRKKEEEEEEEEEKYQKKRMQNSNILSKTGIEEDTIDKNTRNFTKTGQKTACGPCSSTVHG